MIEAMIEVERLVVRYGSATALDRVSLTVGRGEMVALIGPNGAGKSTLINTLSGIVTPASGRVVVRGRLGHVPEGRQLFHDLSVDDNLKLGALPGPRSRHLLGVRALAGARAHAQTEGRTPCPADSSRWWPSAER